MSLKRRITLMISLMLIVMILVSIHAIYKQSSRILNEEAEGRMNAQLDRANENVSLLLKSIVLETENLSLSQQVEDYFMGRLSQKESDKYLTELMAEKNLDRPVYMDLFLVDHEGIIVTAAMPEAVGVDVNGRMYFQKAVFRQVTNTSDIILSRADETQIVITLTPTFSAEGDVLGYTGIAIFATYFSDFLKNFEFNDESQYIIVDSYDKIVSHPDKSRISTQFDNFGMKSLASPRGISTYKIVPIAGIDHVVMQRNLGFNDWRIISFMELDRIHAKSREVSNTMFQIGLVFVCIAIGMGMYITDIVAKPIVAITESINRILEEEASYKTTMINKLPFEHLDKGMTGDSGAQEPMEISNFRKSIQGFKHLLEHGAKNFDMEYNKLKTYIDSMYDELENINKRNLDFIATLSHDIRTPLTLIKGYARGLESGAVADADMERKFKSGIVKSANDLEHLIYNVLDYAYEVGSTSSLNLKTYSIKEAVEQIVFEVRQLYADSDRAMDFDIEDFGESSQASKALVHLDLMNISRVVVNLINNSFKYSSPGDLVALKVFSVQDGVRFEVYDTGMGIRQEDLDKVTDIFYRTQASKEKKGYGLGLYICDQILKSHGYGLRVESELGSFTRVSFVIKALINTPAQ